MADAAHIFVSALDGIAAPGRYGRDTAVPGVAISEVRGAGLATLTVRKGRRAALLDAAQTSFGVALPEAPKRVDGHGVTFIWSGPDQWLAFLPFVAACCLLSETLTSNPFDERLASMIFGVMAGLSQAFLVRASWIHAGERPSLR